MKFLILSLCVCAASAASFGSVYGSGFVPNYAAKAVSAGAAPFQYNVAKASATAGVPVGYVARTQPFAPVQYSANAVAETAAAPAEYNAAVKTVAQNPSVAPVEYTAAKAVAQAVVTPAPYVAKSVVVPVVNTANYAKNVLYKDAESGIVRFENDVQPEGFNYGYETNNGIVAEAAGSLKKVGDANVLAIQGAYRYTAPDGTPVVFTYVADENGYRPESNILPVAPPVPEAIARSLAYIASRPVYVEKTQKY